MSCIRGLTNGTDLHEMHGMKLTWVLNLICGVVLSWSSQADSVRPRILGVAHVALYAKELKASRSFYTEFLGYAEPFSITNEDGGLRLTFFKVNDRQYIEMFPETSPETDRLNHISFETDNVQGMLEYLRFKGIKVPNAASRGRVGNANFNVKDPDGHVVEFVQYLPESWMSRDQGKHLPETRISQRLRHVGVLVGDLKSAKAFYEDVLGFTETWRGGRQTNELSWVNLKVPDGDDYIEFMLYSSLPEPTRRGSANHLCLEVPDMKAAAAKLAERLSSASQAGLLKPNLETRIGMNRKRQMNLFDPDGTRVELMEPRTVDSERAHQ